METSKNHLILNFLRNGRLRVKKNIKNFKKNARELMKHEIEV